MAREIGDLREEEKIIRQFPELSPKFIFMYPGFNMRNNEIGALIGLSQLKNLDRNNKKRSENLNIFLEYLNEHKYYKDFDIIGNSNYAFPIVLKKRSIKNRNLFERLLTRKGIEFRRGNAGGGNQAKQPYLKNYINKKYLKLSNVNIIHDYGYYIGNFPDLSKNKIIKIVNILNNIDFD